MKRNCVFIAERFPGLTGGEDGVVVPAMVLFGHKMGGTFYYYLILVFAIAAYVFCHFLVNSRIGRALRAVRDSEDAAAAMGVDVQHYRVLAWLVSAVFGGIAGALYAQQAGFLSPSTFHLWTNIIVLVMLLVGGIGLNLGAIVGATIMTLLPYFIAGIEEYVLLVNGLILFMVLRFLPEGIVGTIAGLFSRRARAKEELEAAGEPG